MPLETAVLLVAEPVTVTEADPCIEVEVSVAVMV